ncbi:MAG: hypothetical protein ACFFDH_05175 [Promethearchaeota archaeon]
MIQVIIIYPLLYYVIIIKPKIYYSINYNINLSNREEIINNVENLDYTAYLNNYETDYSYEEIYGYVDKDLINLLKERIISDTGFHLFPSYQHYLRYSFLGENISKLYLTYNSNTILSLKNQNNQFLYLREGNTWWSFGWYLNPTYIPHVQSDNSTLELSELIFIAIDVDYEAGTSGFPHEYYYDQYLLLSKTLDVILIFVYFYVFID